MTQSLLATTRDLGLCLLSFLIGLIALSVDGLMMLTLLLAVAWAHASTRAAAYCIGLSYSLGIAATLGSAANQFFPDHAIVTALAPLLYAAYGATAFALFWVPRGSGELRRIVAGALLFLALAVPPFGIAFWGHPVLAAGDLFPSYGVAGIAAISVLWASLSAVRIEFGSKASNELVASIFAAVVIALGVHVQADWQPFERAQIAKHTSLIGVDLQLGKLAESQLGQYRYLGATVAPTVRAMRLTDGMIVVLPESVGGITSTARLAWWRAELKSEFGQGVVLLVGEFGDETGKGVSVISGDQYRYLPARSSVPGVEWRPFNTYAAAAMHSNVIALNGERVAVVQCYEAMTVWLLLIDMLQAPSAWALLSNQWWSGGNLGGISLLNAMHAWQRLSGVPLVIAVNR